MISRYAKKMPKPKITIGAELSMNHDRYRMTLIEVSVSNADSYRTVRSRIACVALSEMQSGVYPKSNRSRKKTAKQSVSKVGKSQVV